MKVKKRPQLPNYLFYLIKLKNNTIILRETSAIISY